MNADEILAQAREAEKKTALEQLEQRREEMLVPEMFWLCDHGHVFGEGLYRDPGRCPSCLSNFIKAVYPAE